MSRYERIVPFSANMPDIDFPGGHSSITFLAASDIAGEMSTVGRTVNGLRPHVCFIPLDAWYLTAMLACFVTHIIKYFILVFGTILWVRLSYRFLWNQNVSIQCVRFVSFSSGFAQLLVSGLPRSFLLLLIGNRKFAPKT